MKAFHTQLSLDVLRKYIEDNQPQTDLERTKLALKWAVDYSQKCIDIIQSGVHDPSEIEKVLYTKVTWKERIVKIFV